MKRRLFIASTIAAALAGCARTTNALNENPQLHGALKLAENLNYRLIGTHGAAKLYTEADITRTFPTNGNDTPSDPHYADLVRARFGGYALAVAGLVEHPQTLDLHALRAMATVSEITRHDCVEGWSVVGKWGGVQLARLLALVRPRPQARYVVFYSYDRDSNGQQFYGSLDLQQAAHPQTQLALDLNGKPIDADHGGPLRLRVPTQLAYKSTKWIQRVELVASLKPIFGGNGGYWEDQGYEWYAGI
ncbi:MAG: molybdopterin-binding protein [Vulcanimicrobiaceae bacterium]